ncbi:carboxy terminal-processing peptidase [Reichenbachiella agarivorans]|uniref:Carboxy terminal-processing peptidase n=1 Tax=Reichenbachiella agarivorans TaxID=2979464 RepID=A0ABY6CPQ6_9BACT|nr:carboxy terminal-processing peptidase [Reichenbachiella agarivorans]UXP31348.1 carboxy terminal-processing peptidase [Reichenbachiella agarivorans]
MKLRINRRNLVLCLLVFQVFASQAFTAGDSVITLEPAAKHWKETYLINNLLNKNHYRKQELNDSLSSVIFHNYLESLDFNKSYFLQADLDYFGKYEFELDDHIKRGNVDVAFQIFRIFRERANTRIDYVSDILDEGFDYTIDEELNLDEKEVKWASTNDEINDRWRKIIKSQALSLKLAGKTDDEIKDSLTKRYLRYRKGINQYNSDDVFQFYMNAYTSSYDPHTNYFSPISSENFNISMSLSLEGIGARLTQSMDYTVVNEVVAGGPAYKSKLLHKDDKIIGVAQGDTEAFVDVIGWRLQDVVHLIRGKKGTVVRLQVLKFDEGTGALPKEIRLVRDKISLEEESAKSEIIPIYNGKETYKLGVITLPSFYINFEEAREGVKDYKSTTRDVNNIIKDLQANNVDGILIDLRYNGGGSLKEAIDMTGLFIDEGPVVQVRNSDGSIEIKRDEDRQIQYTGPLAVMINRFSASASEIFSGAIQDYKRGIIVGEGSFGKGTVQNLIDLNRMFPNDEDQMGQLKLTLAKFYRVSGSSTQNIGVTPDISFPSGFEASEFGESSRPNALPWDRITSSYYRPTNDISPQLIKNLEMIYLNDLKTDRDLQYLVEDVDLLKSQQDENSLSLNYEKRKAESDEDEKRLDGRKNISESAGKVGQEVTTEESQQKKLSDDPYLKEGLKLLAELVKQDRK